MSGRTSRMCGFHNEARFVYNWNLLLIEPALASHLGQMISPVIGDPLAADY